MRTLRGALVAALLAICAAEASAQGFRAVYSPDSIDVIAVGDNGELYRSFDGGNSWNERLVGSASEQHRDIAGTGYTLVIVGAGGSIWRSLDNGGNWTETVVGGGSPDLLSVSMASSQTWFAAGTGGAIFRTTDGGGSWGSLSSGTSLRLNALEFTDAQTGWAAGDDGTLLRTVNGGTTWTPVSLGTANDLLSIDQSGSTVWVVGTEGTAYKSTDGGSGFSPVNLKLDARADVNVVYLQDPDTLWLCGGGGFIRRSRDGGSTWTFQTHRMHAPITDFARVGNFVWATNSLNRIVMYSNDRGAFWRMPTTTTFSRSWIQRLPFNTFNLRGSTFAINPVYKSTLYSMLGVQVYRSRDNGETWTYVDSIAGQWDRANAFIVSPKDSNTWIAALQSDFVMDVLVKTTDGGATWTTVLTHNMGEYGIPLEMDPDHPDTLYFAGEVSVSGSPMDSLRASYDFGATWTGISPALFRSPCDIVVVPDSSNIILVGDGVTGLGRPKLWKSRTRGTSFPPVDSLATGSEIPGMATSRLAPNVSFATNWNAGGIRRTTNFGDTWTQTDLTTQAWGVDVAKDDPNVVMFGRYTAGTAIISTDGGASGTWSTITAPGGFGGNYSYLLRDRATIFAMQGSSGIWKMTATYNYTPGTFAQSVSLLAPNSGEVWNPGNVHTISWDAANIGLARLEYRRSPSEPWIFIADVRGYLNSYAWTIPYAGSNQAQVRVSDAWDGVPEDISSGMFTIPGPYASENPGALDYGAVNVSTSNVQSVTIYNAGTQTLNVSSIYVNGSPFHVGRSSLVLAPSVGDTTGVWFEPTTTGPFADTVRIVSDDPGRPLIKVFLSGVAGPFIQVLAPNGGEAWAYNTLHDVAWTTALVSSVDLAYREHPDSAWTGIASGLPATPASYAWTIPFDMTITAQLRIQTGGGPPLDYSDADFSLTAALFAATPDTVRPPVAQTGGSPVSDTLRIENPGTAPLTVSNVTLSDPEFWVGRTSFVVPPGSSDTLGVYYAAAEDGYDTTSVTIVANDPGGSHLSYAVGRGVPNVAVGDGGERGLAFVLDQNHPNPFARSTLIHYALPRDGDVSLEVFDLRGQRVATLVRGREAAGRHGVTFGRGAPGAGGERIEALPSGVYFYRLRSAGFAVTRKMLLLN